MTPDEVILEVESKGIKTSRSTLLRYEKQGLIPLPERGSDGRGKGRFSEYPDDTPDEYFAAYILTNKPYRMSYEDVKVARETALGLMDKNIDVAIRKIKQYDLIKACCKDNSYEEHGTWFKWWQLKLVSQNDIKISSISDNSFGTSFQIPIGISQLHDEILQEIKNYKTKNEAHFVYSEIEEVDRKQRFYHDQIKHFQQEASKGKKRQNDMKELLLWFDMLSDEDKTYIHKLFIIYKTRKTARDEVQKKIKEKFVSTSSLILDIFNNQAK